MKSIKSNRINVGMQALSASLAFTVFMTPLMVQASGNTVTLAGTNVISLTAPAGGATADVRAEAIQRSLNNALVATPNRAPSAVKVVFVKGVPIVTLGGYYVATVDTNSAKKAGITPTVLANRWADNLRRALLNKSRIESYVAELTGQPHSDKLAALPQASSVPSASHTAKLSSPNQVGSKHGYVSRQVLNGRKTKYDPTYSQTASNNNSVNQARIVYIPAGMVLPITLKTAVSSKIASPGDRIEATLAQNIDLGDATLPAGSVLMGSVTSAQPGARKSMPGHLGVRFTTFITPDGVQTPIRGHLIGGIEKLGSATADGEVSYAGETKKTKYQQTAIRGGIGAVAGTLIGGLIGAIAGHHGAGRGALAGLVIGGGAGVADGMFLRKGRDVTLPSGQAMQLQLDSPAKLASNI